MEPIKFEITREDIGLFLEEHQNDPYYSHREALFVKYMKENGVNTQEFTEIYALKNGLICQEGYPKWYEKKSPQVPLQTFSKYCENLSLDISGLCHIFIPALGFFSYQFGCSSVGTYYHFVNVRKKLFPPVQKFDSRPKEWEFQIFKSAVDDFQVANQLEIEFLREEMVSTPNWGEWKISKKSCAKILKEDEKIYGSFEVEKVKSLVKEEIN